MLGLYRGSLTSPPIVPLSRRPGQAILPAAGHREDVGTDGFAERLPERLRYGGRRRSCGSAGGGRCGVARRAASAKRESDARRDASKQRRRRPPTVTRPDAGSPAPPTWKAAQPRTNRTTEPHVPTRGAQRRRRGTPHRPHQPPTNPGASRRGSRAPPGRYAAQPRTNRTTEPLPKKSTCARLGHRIHRNSLVVTALVHRCDE